ncbi:hypothetical protein BC939DRAFT_469589 [Gamsiella multidivaricata]|uniref:uncharacterized protein n=1 Tax=Gamsiella multidivaricata TaxID=101098 RepID=UPI00221F4F4F|nr:uncharacterized protein BC939DRAFT_469589 [Gamsiella multidivaricata]KAI7816276.1 hypothetical protein BC939DRAFT_469589 [Gamsiella multidivaricata]
MLNCSITIHNDNRGPKSPFHIESARREDGRNSVLNEGGAALCQEGKHALRKVPPKKGEQKTMASMVLSK